MSSLETVLGSGCLTLPFCHNSYVLLQCSLLWRSYVAHKNSLERGHLPHLMPNLAPFAYANLINGQILFSQQLHCSMNTIKDFIKVSPKQLWDH